MAWHSKKINSDIPQTIQVLMDTFYMPAIREEMKQHFDQLINENERYRKALEWMVEYRGFYYPDDFKRMKQVANDALEGK